MFEFYTDGNSCHEYFAKNVEHFANILKVYK